MLSTMKEAVQQRRAAPFEANIRTGRLLSDLILDSVQQEEAFADDTALCVVGSMAGYSAAVAASQAFARSNPDELLDEDYAVTFTPDGTRRLSGTFVNDALISGPKAFWRLLDAKARAMSGASMAGLAEIIAHVDATVLTPEFGTPRMPGSTRCLETPAILVDHLWQEFLPTLTAIDPDPQGWCASWGFAAQDILEEVCQSMPCSDAMRIIMECAIPMSRRDPEDRALKQAAA